MTNSPALNGCSLGLLPGIPLPSIAGWLMPSLNPNGSVSVGKAWQFCRQMASIPVIPRETVERLLRHAQGFETLVSECDAYPRVGQRARGVGRGAHRAGNSPHQLT